MAPIKVLFLASEAEPFIKIGGLGDVAGSLPIALRALDAQLEIHLVLPHHKRIDLSSYSTQSEPPVKFSANNVKYVAQPLSLVSGDVKITFISGEPISACEKVYSTDILKDADKFTFFVFAAMYHCQNQGWQPDVLFANDWHTAISTHIVKHNLMGSFWSKTRTILAIHNLAYMGAGSELVLSKYGIEPVESDLLPWWGKHVPLPMGALAADKIVTVSPTYAKEIQSEEFGCGLDPFFQARSNDIVGIVNGIDLQMWDPSTDQHILARFSANELKAKSDNKAALQQLVGLPADPSVPLLAMVTRMDQQKGVDLLVHAANLLVDEQFQLIILGTGNPEIEKECLQLQSTFPQKVRALIKFDSILSRKVYAGADMITMPSRYEPCGIAQMISMRYGSIPIARSTGGLKDTIHEGETGFLFEKADPTQLAECIRKAKRTFAKRSAWNKIQLTCMAEDFSWNQSAVQYLSLFQELLREGK